MKIQDNSKLIFIGDSISDFERARPCGEGLFGGIGKHSFCAFIGIVKFFLPSLFVLLRLFLCLFGVVVAVLNRFCTLVHNLFNGLEQEVLQYKKKDYEVRKGNQDIPYVDGYDFQILHIELLRYFNAFLSTFTRMLGATNISSSAITRA